MRRVRTVAGFGVILIAFAPNVAVADTALPPPKITVLTNRGGLAPGYTFVAPKGYADPTRKPTGLLIIDGSGRPVWWRPAASGMIASDVRVQTYRNQPVLTWSEGVRQPGHSESVDYIADSHYHVIATVEGGNGLSADNHEFQLTARGSALITSYHARQVDLSAVGGPVDGQLMDSSVQEIDIATGAVLFDWDAYENVPLTDSYLPLPDDPATPWDFFHVNSVQVDTDGNLLVDGRNTWTGYKLDRQTGDTIWRLGGKRSSFTVGPGAHFSWQHDLEPVSRGVVRLFDNGASLDDQQEPESRVVTLSLNTKRHTATLVSALTHPDHLSAQSSGNAQLLPDGHLMVGWGQTGRFSEFDADGRLIFDARVPVGGDTYRAYRYPWVGRPSTSPSASVQRNASGSVVHAVWNGATQVTDWQVYGGADAAHLRRLTTVAWNGLDTTITLAGQPAVVQAVALNAAGKVIGRSPVVAS